MTPFFGSTSVKLLLGQHNIWLNADVDDTSSDVDDTASSSLSMIQLSALGVNDTHSVVMKMTQLSVCNRQRRSWLEIEDIASRFMLMTQLLNRLR